MTNKRYALGRVLSVGSSSEGNAYYIEINRKGYPSAFKLLIECGFPYSELSRRLLNYGVSLNKIDACLVTHLHQDHAQAVPQLIERGKKVFAPMSVFEKYGVLDRVSTRNIMVSGSLKMIADKISVTSMALKHVGENGEDIENMGYIIDADCDYGKFQILFIIDTKFVKWNLSDYAFNVIFIEANNMTRNIVMGINGAKANGDKWKEMHFARVLNSHMLVENCVKTLVGSKSNRGFNLSKCDTIYLTHLTAHGSVNPLEVKKYVVDALENNHLTRLTKHGDKTYKQPRVVQFQRNGEPM